MACPAWWTYAAASAGARVRADRRRGEKRAAKGVYRDPGRSAQAPFVKARGWRGVSLRRLAPMPWPRRRWGLPFRTGLSPAERDAQPRGHRPRPVWDRVRHAVWRVRR
jgi:hypothetical protein